MRHPLQELPEITKWVDLLYARRELERRLLRDAQSAPIAWDSGTMLAVVPVDGLILMKLMAMVGDPRRVQDRQDILDLLRHHAYEIRTRRISTEAVNLGKDYAEAWQQLLEAHRSGAARPGPIDGL